MQISLSILPGSVMYGRWILMLVVVVVCTSGPLRAQAGVFYRLETIGSDADDRARLAQLLGERRSHGYLLRSPSSVTPALNDSAERDRFRWAVVIPELVAVGNSSLPFSLNDGALWAGRGWSESLRAGFRVERGRLSLTLAPELVASENIVYELAAPEVTLGRPPGRNPLSSPWHVQPYSIDLPQRFGYLPIWRLDPGQSVFAVDAGRVTIGVATESEWWGPGVHNAIVLSNNAPGIPRLFLRTTRPVPTRIGTIEARWFVGALSESDYFDTDPTNDLRSIAGLGLAWGVKWAPGLTLGVARTVYAPVREWSGVPLRIFDVFRTFGPSYADPTDTTPGRDQVYSLFGRWVLSPDRFAVYFEWARTAFPSSVRDLLIAPNRTRGYTVGLEWAQLVRGGHATLRIGGEVTSLEKNSAYRDRPVATFYTSRHVTQGYTQRGQVIGAAIGPGASSQWLRVDYFVPRWRVGVFGGRIRWDDDALYTFPNDYDAKWCSHDVSLFAGVSAGGSGRWGSAHLSLTRGERLNVFFHHLTGCDPAPSLGVVDARTTTLELRLSPP